MDVYIYIYNMLIYILCIYNKSNGKDGEKVENGRNSSESESR